MKMILKNLIFCILFLLLFSCEKENLEITRIHGVVYNINSSDPVPGAMVLIAGRSDGIYYELDSIETDEMGRFALSYDSRRFRSIYKYQAFSPNHAPWYSKTSSINWPNFVNAGFKGQRDIYIIPRSWLRIRAVKVSNATSLFINPIWDRFPVATGAPDITFFGLHQATKNSCSHALESMISIVSLAFVIPSPITLLLMIRWMCWWSGKMILIFSICLSNNSAGIFYSIRMGVVSADLLQTTILALY